MNPHLGLLILYSGGIIGLGLWTARLVRGSSEFFVAGRSLGPGLILASMLAANIGAGSTVGAAGLAYRDGVSAWWWVGSAGLGSLVFAFLVAPRLWRLAREHGFYTTGDYLEHRYSPAVRGLATVLVGLGSLALLAGQLIAGAAILNVVTGLPRWAGALAGGTIMTVYFTAGGLLGSAWINALQLVVMLAGFLVALPVAIASAGGVGSLTGATAPPWFGDFTYSAGADSGWMLLALIGPSFIVSPGLIQKAYGGASARAVRLGVAGNAVALLAFAFVPVLFGMLARVQFPGITDPNAVLPTVLTEGLPPWLGALALAAVFSTEVDTCDAILFMLSTSASKDVYKRFVNPAASDRRLLRVGRGAAIGGGAAGVALSMVLATVIDAVTVFYSLLVVTLFVPILGGLYAPRAGAAAALAAMVSGVAALFAVRLSAPAGVVWLNPTLSGIAAAAAAYSAVAVVAPLHARVSGRGGSSDPPDPGRRLR
jgi:SSS family solute:Na+ symporter